MEVVEARERLPKENKGKAKEKDQAWDEVQSMLNKEEVEGLDFLQRYLHLLSPSLIELLREKEFVCLRLILSVVVAPPIFPSTRHRSHGERLLFEEELIPQSLARQRYLRRPHRGAPPPPDIASGLSRDGADSRRRDRPDARDGEIVVFDEHFYRGFGFPTSTFFSNWIIFFGMQPHHLAPNAILQLSSFVVLCEGFLGIKPPLDLWQTLLFLKQQSRKMDKAELENLDGPRPMTPGGAALVHHRSKSYFPQMPLQESIKQWQKGFFYVKNASPTHDAPNMPPFNIDPPMEKLN
ncbi:hypothetical protein D1007_37940 [Hordeum vulgare]|nr:hypothetical protein D1007_37940 [Hordeum vulgare]